MSQTPAAIQEARAHLLGEATYDASTPQPKAKALLDKMYAHRKQLDVLMDEMIEVATELKNEHHPDGQRLLDLVDGCGAGLLKARTLLSKIVGGR